MNSISFTRFATASVAAGVASLALCAPASATQLAPPGGSDVSTSNVPPSSPSPSAPAWNQLALGAGGGVALVGAGVAAALAGKRRRASPTAHPV